MTTPLIGAPPLEALGRHEEAVAAYVTPLTFSAQRIGLADALRAGPFVPESIFELQDQVVPTIVSTVADMNGVLPHAMSEVLRGREPRSLTPYEAVLRSFGYVERLDEEEHAIVRSALERTVREAPGDADGWAMLSYVFTEEHKHDFNVLPGSLDRGLDAARRAVAAAPSSHLGYHNMPSYFYTHAVLAAAYGQLDERAAARRALAELLAQKPDFASIARRELGKWYIDPQLLEEMLDGLARAGLAIIRLP